MKRFAFLVVAAALFYLMIFSVVKGYFLLSGGATAALIFLMIRGARLEAKDVTEKITRQIKQYNEQAKWSGTALIVKPRWFKRLCFVLALLAAFIPCLNGALTFQLTGEGKVSLFLFLVGASLVFGYAAWITLAGLVREIKSGYSLKIDSDGFSIAGHPTMPWRDVYRVGHWYREDRGFVHHFLDIELSASGIQDHWKSRVRPLLIGPLAIVLPIMRGTGTFKLRGTFLSLPVPMIVTAICEVGSRHSPNPVVQLNPQESLEDARKLAVLWSKASQPIDQSEQESAFQKAASSFSKPGGVVDSADLDSAMANIDKEFSARSGAFSEYLELKTKVMSQGNKQSQKQIEHDGQLLIWIFAGALLVLPTYFLGRWILG
ncbi:MULTISPECIES: hypothetical protein [unclassified Polaromonas]|uniref:hypothetical protein n=1 Tax=unclassified Polaromonas TaxID=2638319 RepID=UPI00129E28FA|nr:MULTISPECIES: hypothetical protein [unclassified Polaromonas]QGJ17295.1 hypothetical protein F7R28_02105 [Polaromonas sp. Pch-P]